MEINHIFLLDQNHSTSRGSVPWVNYSLHTAIDLSSNRKFSEYLCADCNWQDVSFNRKMPTFSPQVNYKFNGAANGLNHWERLAKTFVPARLHIHEHLIHLWRGGPLTRAPCCHLILDGVTIWKSQSQIQKIIPHWWHENRHSEVIGRRGARRCSRAGRLAAPVSRSGSEGSSFFLLISTWSRVTGQSGGGGASISRREGKKETWQVQTIMHIHHTQICPFVCTPLNSSSSERCSRFNCEQIPWKEARFLLYVRSFSHILTRKTPGVSEYFFQPSPPPSPSPSHQTAVKWGWWERQGGDGSAASKHKRTHTDSRGRVTHSSMDLTILTGK